MHKLSDIAGSTLADVARRDAIKVSPESELGTVVSMMHEHRRGSVLVMDGERLVGIFTERDLMRRIDHSDRSWLKRPVREVMTPKPQTIGLERTIEDTLNAMLVGGYRHLPVVNADGMPIGIVSIRDILVYIADFFPDDFLNLPCDPEHEADKPWGG